MSYILDALKKAERDHQVSRVPTLATAHGGADLRRGYWIWPVAGAAIAVGALVAYTLQWAPARPARRDPVGEVKPPATSGVVAVHPDPPATTPPRASAPPERTVPPTTEVTGPPAERTPSARASAVPEVAPSASTPKPPPAANRA